MDVYMRTRSLYILLSCILKLSEWISKWQDFYWGVEDYSPLLLFRIGQNGYFHRSVYCDHFQTSPRTWLVTVFPPNVPGLDPWLVGLVFHSALHCSRCGASWKFHQDKRSRLEKRVLRSKVSSSVTNFTSETSHAHFTVDCRGHSAFIVMLHLFRGYDSLFLSEDVLLHCLTCSTGLLNCYFTETAECITLQWFAYRFCCSLRCIRSCLM